MIDEFHEQAERTGAKVVTAAGVDSIPSDLGTQLAIERLAEKGGRAAHVKVLFTDYAGSLSGGTSRSIATRKKVLKSDQYEADFHTGAYVLAPSAELKSSEETLPAGILFVSTGIYGVSAGRSSWRPSTPLRPKSGEGPPPWLRRAGKFRALVHATNEDRSELALVDVRGVISVRRIPMIHRRSSLCMETSFSSAYLPLIEHFL